MQISFSTLLTHCCCCCLHSMMTILMKIQKFILSSAMCRHSRKRVRRVEELFVSTIKNAQRTWFCIKITNYVVCTADFFIYLRVNEQIFTKHIKYFFSVSKWEQCSSVLCYGRLLKCWQRLSIVSVRIILLFMDMEV